MAAHMATLSSSWHKALGMLGGGCWRAKMTKLRKSSTAARASGGKVSHRPSYRRGVEGGEGRW